MYNFDLTEFDQIISNFFSGEHSKGIKQYEEAISWRDVWDNFDNLTQEQTRNVILDFLNKWQCRLSYSFVPVLTTSLIETEPLLKPLRTLKIEDLNLHNNFPYNNNEIELLNSIKDVFDKISNTSIEIKNSNRTIGSTATSKLLHMAVPDLFVMWESDIRKYYGYFANGSGYINFMIKMNQYANYLVSHKDISKFSVKTSIPRLLDIYNLIMAKRNKASIHARAHLSYQK